MSQDFMNERQVADYLGVDPRTVRKYVEAGRLMRYKRLGRTFYKRDDVEQLAEPQPQEKERKDNEE